MKIQYAFPLLFSCLDQLDFLQDYLRSHLIQTTVSINFYKGEAWAICTYAYALYRQKFLTLMLPLIRRRKYFTLLTRVVESRVAVTDDVERICLSFLCLLIFTQHNIGVE